MNAALDLLGYLEEEYSLILLEKIRVKVRPAAKQTLSISTARLILSLALSLAILNQRRTDCLNQW